MFKALKKILLRVLGTAGRAHCAVLFDPAHHRVDMTAPHRKGGGHRVRPGSAALLQSAPAVAGALRALTKPATAKIALIYKKSEAIFASCVSCTCILRSLTSM